jgi:hypothetical protein
LTGQQRLVQSRRLLSLKGQNKDMADGRKLTKAELAVEVLARFGTTRELRGFFNALELLVEGSPGHEALIASVTPTKTRRRRRRGGEAAVSVPSRKGRQAQPGSISSRLLAFASGVKSFGTDEAMAAIGWRKDDAKRRKHMQVTLSNLKVKKHIKRLGPGRYAAK